jgi:predicted O-methyltransferase YrrM
MPIKQNMKFVERFGGSFLFHYGRLPLLLNEALKNRRFIKKMSVENLHPSLMSRSDVYRYFENQFRFRSPQFLWKHNWYFKQHNRGFGEPAFHAVWHQILEELKPRKCLEIGVYRGQTISLWSLIAENLNFNCKVVGITPLTRVGDSFSQYLDVDYLADINKNFEKFKLQHGDIVKDFSTGPVGTKTINSGNWDLIYIDGSHDFEDVYLDYFNSISGLASNGIIVMDDSSMYLEEVKGYAAFQGHPGPSRVCADHAMNDLEHFLSVGHLNFFRKK